MSEPRGAFRSISNTSAGPIGNSSAGPITLCLLVFAVVSFWGSTLHAAAVTVRFTEGMVRGFLVLSNTHGERLASGDFLQVGREGEIKSRTLLKFKDGSVHDETAVFSQEHSFILRSYRLVQKGPAFNDDMDITLERATGKYRVKVTSHKDRKEKVLEGKLDLPQDVYNGMVPTVAKNLPKGARETVHMVAFTPTPRIVELEMIPSGEDKVLIGDLKQSAVHYVLKPKLGLLLKLPAAVLGRTPPDNHLWVITTDVPAFVRFDGPLATDAPIWRVELTSPVWPK
jgi:hypothetical protein